MAQTITKSQAELIASGFLDGLGSNPEFSDFVPDQTLTTLVSLAAMIIQSANDNLQSSGNVSSGKLSDSLKILDPHYVGNQIALDIEALFYYQFLNKGVRGTKQGSGQFSFKSSFPSKKMVDEIRGWLKKAGASSFNIKKSVSNLESKNKSIAQFDKAYAVARAIKMKGIRANGFFDKAVKVAQGYAESELGKSLAIDVINSLPSTLDGNSPKF